MAPFKNYIIDRDEIIGSYEHLHEFYSMYLRNERDVIVWFPPSYFHSHKNFPVLYMHDGQNLFNPHTSFIGYDWKMDETSTILMEDKIIEEFIIVAIYNTKDRLEEYNYFTRKGRNYAFFIIRELKRYIDENFRTLTDAKNTALMGSSMGGLISFQMYWNFPEVFGKAACLSNSFWVDDGAVFDMVKENPEANKNGKLYIDCGSEEKELVGDFKKMCALLKEYGYEENKNLKCEIIEGAKHSEVDWAARAHLPLEFLFGLKNNNP